MEQGLPHCAGPETVVPSPFHIVLFGGPIVIKASFTFQGLQFPDMICASHGLTGLEAKQNQRARSVSPGSGPAREPAGQARSARGPSLHHQPCPECKPRPPPPLDAQGYPPNRSGSLCLCASLQPEESF